MALFILVTTHLAACYLHAVLSVRFHPLRKEDGVTYVFWLGMITMSLLHLFYCLAHLLILLELEQYALLAMVLGLLVIPFLPPVMIPMFWGELTTLPEKPNFLARRLQFLAIHSMQAYKASLVISVVIAILVITRTFPLSNWDATLWYDSRETLFFTLALSGVWILMMLSGLRPNDSQINSTGKPFRVLMLLLVAAFIFAFWIDPREFWWDLIPIISTVSVSLTFSWYRFRLQFVDMIFNQLVQIILMISVVIGGGLLLRRFPVNTFAVDDSETAIALVALLIYAVFAYLVFRTIQSWFQSFWRPNETRLKRIHSELPQALSKCIDEQSANRLTEEFLSKLFDAQIKINRPLEEPAHKVVIEGSPTIQLELSLINGWVPWLSESLQWIDTAGRYLQSHLRLLDTLKTIRDKDRQAEALSALAARSELNAMRAQIRPHFLFNTLNSIHSFVRARPEQAEKTIIMLADLMRGVLQTSNQDQLSLEQELALAETYLKIEKVRHGDRLEFNFNIEPGSEQQAVPSFCVQPLVENAVKHAVETQFDAVIIEVCSFRNDNQLHLMVTDNGPGLADQSPQGLGMALNNIRERLKGLYGDSATLTLENKDQGGLTAHIRLPLN